MSAPNNQAQLPSHSSSADNPNNRPLSWEGDKMFNIYIYDYCSKRGFRKTAQELLVEAELEADSRPPINARQGLLFEWWSVFWVLFSAKSSGAGPEDAMVYTQASPSVNHSPTPAIDSQKTQYQTQQAAARQAAARVQPLPSQQIPRQQLNGMPPRTVHQQPGFIPNGAQLAPNAMTPFAVPGSAPPNPSQQPNGISLSQPNSQPSNNMMFSSAVRRESLPPNARINGMHPFPSPTMAHSPSHQPQSQQPQHPSQQPQQQQQPQQPQPPTQQQPQQPQQHPHPAMGQLAGPSPHMQSMQAYNRNMLPPGRNTPTPSTGVATFQGGPGARPPSRVDSPSGLTKPSPSLVARQIQQQQPIPSNPDLLNQELNGIPVVLLNQLRAQAGITDKDQSAMTLEEKQRIVAVYRNTKNQTNAPRAGPSVLTPQMSQQQRSNTSKRNSTSPGGPGAEADNNPDISPPTKRARRSPAPPDQSPSTNSLTANPPPPPVPPSSVYPQQSPHLQNRPGMPPNQPPIAHHPGQIPRNPMTGGTMMNGSFGAQGAGMIGSGGPMMGMAGIHGNTMMHPQYRQVHGLHQKSMGAGLQMSTGMGSPAADQTMFQPSGQPPIPVPNQPPFNPASVGQRGMVGAPPKQMNGPLGMMPPQSPSINGGTPKGTEPPKDGGIKPNESPRGVPNQPASSTPGPTSSSGGPNAAGGQPPSAQGSQQGGGGAGVGGQQQPPSAQPTNSLTAPSPNGSMNSMNMFSASAGTGGTTGVGGVGGSGAGGNGGAGGVGGTGAGAGSAADLFPTDFSLDDLDANMFKSDSDLTFERDFGQWFNEDMGGLPDLK